MKYGIKMVTVEWACENGGDDCIGTREEMAALITKWKTEETLPNVRYTVVPYSGEEGKPPTFPHIPENSRNSRMKR